MITRDEALRIAATEILIQGIGTGTDGARLSSPPFKGPFYMSGRPRPELSWVVTIAQPITGLRSTDVVYVSAETGEITYVGSSNNEG